MCNLFANHLAFVLICQVDRQRSLFVGSKLLFGVTCSRRGSYVHALQAGGRRKDVLSKCVFCSPPYSTTCELCATRRAYV